MTTRRIHIKIYGGINQTLCGRPALSTIQFYTPSWELAEDFATCKICIKRIKTEKDLQPRALWSVTK